jgi:hypothetical protein
MRQAAQKQSTLAEARTSRRVCNLHFHVRAALVAELDFFALGKFAHIAAKDEERAVRAPDVGGCPLHHLHGYCWRQAQRARRAC